MKDNKKSIIIGAAFIVVALCITGAYMIVTWEPDDSIKPFSAETVSYDNTPSKGNELWDAMIETGASEIEKVKVTYMPHIYRSFYVDGKEEIQSLLEESGIDQLQFSMKDPPLEEGMLPYPIYLYMSNEEKQEVRIYLHVNGIVKKEENGEVLYSSNALDVDALDSYFGELQEEYNK